MKYLIVLVLLFSGCSSNRSKEDCRFRTWYGRLDRDCKVYICLPGTDKPECRSLE